MRTAIHVNGAERVRTADIENEESLEIRHVDEFHTIRSQELTRSAGWLASCVRLKSIPPIFVQPASPGLEGNFAEPRFQIRELIHTGLNRKLIANSEAGPGKPDSGLPRRRSEIHSAVGMAWSGWRLSQCDECNDEPMRHARPTIQRAIMRAN